MRTGTFMMLIVMACACPNAVASAENAQPRFRIGSRPEQVMGTRITVSNLHRSLDFYTQVVGLKEFQIPGVPRPNIDDPNSVGIVFLNFTGSHADPMLTLWKQKDRAPTEESAKLTLVGLKVQDVRAVLSRAKATGAVVQVEAKEFMRAAVGVVLDPDGYGVEIVEAPSVAGEAVSSSPQ